MYDISACEYDNCPKKLDCYRYMGVRSSHQTYNLFQNICKESNDYKWFYNIDGRPVREIVEKVEETNEPTNEQPN